MKSHALTLLFVGSVSSLLLAVSPARALTVYTEASNRDLSNDGLHPTSIAVAPGSNQVFGTTGRSGAIDVDYFTFVVPSGYAWSALELLPGTVAGGSLSFIGLEAGNEVTVSASAADATGLLGWTHYGSGAIDADLLPFMGAPSLGSTGFTPRSRPARTRSGFRISMWGRSLTGSTCRSHRCPNRTPRRWFSWRSESLHSLREL